MSEDFLVLVVIPIAILFLSFVQEKGFENLISQPVIEQWLKKLKPAQPYLVTAIGILLAYVSQQVGVELVPDLAPYLNATGDVGTIFAGLVMSVLSMWIHGRNKPVAVG